MKLTVCSDCGTVRVLPDDHGMTCSLPRFINNILRQYVGDHVEPCGGIVGPLTADELKELFGRVGEE